MNTDTPVVEERDLYRVDGVLMEEFSPPEEYAPYELVMPCFSVNKWYQVATVGGGKCGECVELDNAMMRCDIEGVVNTYEPSNTVNQLGEMCDNLDQMETYQPPADGLPELDNAGMIMDGPALEDEPCF
jgi:hypothetical protein